MANERAVEEVLALLSTHAAHLWGEEDADRQRPILQQTAEQIVTMNRYTLPPDLEPCFF